MLPLLSALAWSFPTTLPAQALSQVRSADSASRHWILRADYELGRPTGWVQVRENQIAGTRLSFGPGLGVRTSSMMGLTMSGPVGSGTISIDVSGSTLRGSTFLQAPVYFNGSTLMSGTVLRTRTEPGDFLRVVVGYEHPWARVGPGGLLAWRVGVDATLLNFRLSGTLDPATVGHETKEDFVTQELPAPFVGAALTLPVTRVMALHLRADGGWLPWVSSFRYEGGLVTLNQRRWDVAAELEFPLAQQFTVGLGVHTTGFAQNEQSHEDGNQISLATTAVLLRLQRAFF